MGRNTHAAWAITPIYGAGRPSVSFIIGLTSTCLEAAYALMMIAVIGLHDELVRVLRASFPGESLEIVCFPDVAAALAAPVPSAVAWLLVDARSLGDRVFELRAWVRQQPQAQSVLLCDDDLPWPAQLAEQAGFAEWYPKGRLHELPASLSTLAAA